jgi:hypothetical protein
MRLQQARGGRRVVGEHAEALKILAEHEPESGLSTDFTPESAPTPSVVASAHSTAAGVAAFR